ncbi:MAG: response regulator transcription factor [Betaproteobacteria bacterium]|nr:response regulator transcription factor [Betaproteobacteria bacterium]
MTEPTPSVDRTARAVPAGAPPAREAESEAPPGASAQRLGEWPAPAPAADPGAMPGGEGRAARLLLFVGAAARPEASLASLLAREGLRCLSLPGAEQAVRAAALARFDAVLIDASLVDGRAIDALASSHGCPIVVLADEADEIDEIVALELGADLYLVRPLAPRRLRAHVRALLRRRAAAGSAAGTPLGSPIGSPAGTPTRSPTGATAPAAASLQAGGWTLEPARLRLVRGARNVRLTHAQAAMLRSLMTAAGDIVSAEDLHAALPRHERLQVRSLRVHVHRLRQRLRDEGVDELQIEAVRGSGYALALPCAQAA